MSAALFVLLAAGPANAFEHTGFMWAPDQLPLVFYMTDYLEDSLPQAILDETGRTYQEDIIIKSYCNWHWTDYCEANVPADWTPNDGATCAEIDYDYAGIRAGNEGNTVDGITKFYWDDPDDAQGTGVLAVTYTRPGTELVKELAGNYYYRVTDSDIVFNNDVDWATTQELEAGSCGGAYSVEEVATHEIGHMFGMDHSCEDGDVCTNDAFKTATMYWEGGACSLSAATIGSDDIEGITAIYGPYVTFTTEDERFGAAPLEICFTLEADEATREQITSVEWSFGDGETSTELEPCHTYTTQGQFTVNVDFNGTGETCGEWSYKASELAFALVCDRPQPDFEIEHVDGLVYEIINNTDVSTYGCVDGINFKVYEGGSASGEPLLNLGAWSPKVEFPAEGTYTIVLTAQGPASDDGVQATRTVEVVDKRGAGTGCSTAGGGLSAAAGLLALGALVRRRRA